MKDSVQSSLPREPLRFSYLDFPTKISKINRGSYSTSRRIQVPVPMNPQMNSEIWRLQSFKDAINVEVSMIYLAKEGFYFDHNTGLILCFSCNYPYSSQSSTLHEIVHAPHCRRRKFNQSFRKGISGRLPDVVRQDQPSSTQQNNNDQDLPNAADVQEPSTSTNESVDNSVNGHSNYELLNNEQVRGTSARHELTEDRPTQSSPTITPQITTFSQAQAITARGSASEHSTLDISRVSYPNFSTRQARISTFTGWNPAHSHRPEDFADLGFFYTGREDLVRCFCCGVGFKFWRHSDDISYQHTRQRPTCAFNRLCKGQLYIDRVLQEIQSQQDEPNRDQLALLDASSPSSGAASTGTSLPEANGSLRGQQTATSHIHGIPAATKNRQISPTATADRHISSAAEAIRQTNNAVTSTGETSPARFTYGLANFAYTTNGQTNSAYTTNRQPTSPYTTNGQTSSTYTTNGQTSTAYITNGQTSTAYTTNEHRRASVSTNIQTNLSFTTQTTPTSNVSINGLATSSDTTTLGGNSSLARSSPEVSGDSLSSENSGLASVSCANAVSTLESATNGDLADSYQANPPREEPTTTTMESTLDQEIRVVKREHSILKQRIRCHVCLTTPVNCIFLPCGHVATCQGCADKITICVICSKVIIGTANVYLS